MYSELKPKKADVYISIGEYFGYLLNDAFGEQHVRKVRIIIFDALGLMPNSLQE